MTDKKFALIFSTILLITFALIKSSNIDSNTSTSSIVIEPVDYLIDFEEKNEHISLIHYQDTTISKKIAVIKPHDIYGPNIVLSKQIDISKIESISIEQDVFFDENVIATKLTLSIDNLEGNVLLQGQHLTAKTNVWYRTKNTFYLKGENLKKDSNNTLKIYLIKQEGTAYLDKINLSITYELD